jgi:predicted DNA-binding antitoxin AbrB/MazE fold protein
MIRAKGRYRNQILELDQPLALAEGTEVEIDIHLAEEAQGAEHQEWAELGIQRLEDEWENPEDAVYDDWKKLYGV